MKAVVFALVFTLGAAWSAAAGDLRLEFQDGFVTLSARDVPVRQILAEWARRGQTKIINGERVVSAPVTLELTHVPEKQALEIVLHSVAGYLAAPRAGILAGASAFDRIVVMATSSAAPAMAPMRPPAGGMVPTYQPQVQPPVDMQSDDEQDEPIGPQMEQPAFGVPGGEVGQPGPTGPNGFLGSPPGTMGPNGNVLTPGAVPPQITPESTNPLRAYQPPQQATDPNVQVPVQPPGPSPMQPGTVTIPSPGQIQASQPPQTQTSDPPQ